MKLPLEASSLVSNSFYYSTNDCRGSNNCKRKYCDQSGREPAGIMVHVVSSDVSTCLSSCQPLVRSKHPSLPVSTPGCLLVYPTPCLLFFLVSLLVYRLSPLLSPFSSPSWAPFWSPSLLWEPEPGGRALFVPPLRSPSFPLFVPLLSPFCWGSEVSLLQVRVADILHSGGCSGVPGPRRGSQAEESPQERSRGPGLRGAGSRVPPSLSWSLWHSLAPRGIGSRRLSAGSRGECEECDRVRHSLQFPSYCIALSISSFSLSLPLPHWEHVWRAQAAFFIAAIA